MVNSEARAVRGQAMLEVALAGLVRAPLTERADLDQMLADQRGATPQPSGLSPEEERAAVRQALDNHYRNVMDGIPPPRAALPGSSSSLILWRL